jgi:hypothetical protein
MKSLPELEDVSMAPPRARSDLTEWARRRWRKAPMAVSCNPSRDGGIVVAHPEQSFSLDLGNADWE